MLVIVDGSRYDSRVESIDYDRLVIAMPVSAGRPLSASRGAILHISAVVGSEVVSFDSRIMQITKTPFYQLVMTTPDTLQHEKMREFTRVPVHLRVRVFLGTLEGVSKSGKPVPFCEGIINDLSGGGCRLMCDTAIVKGGVIVLDLINDSLDGVQKFECKVVRAAFQSNGKWVI
ncbi:MAG: flagellar brake protein, partial [Deferribacteraceae bacterium]|nr:flagellar brake protein [Deferribacteraceae bacterium]